MKFGMRKPSIKKSFKARTTAKYKRKVKKALIPGYGKKGMGWVKNPKKAAYNKVYKKTTFSIWDLFKSKKELSKEVTTFSNAPQMSNSKPELTAAEIEVLNWCHKKPVSTRFPEHFWFEHGIKENSIINLINKEYIHYADPFEALDGLTIIQLKNILKTKELKISGNKRELVARIEENFSPKFLEPLIKQRVYYVSDKGVKYLHKQDKLLSTEFRTSSTKNKKDSTEIKSIISKKEREKQLLITLDSAISKKQFNTAIQTVNELCKLTNDMRYLLIAFCIDICGLTNFNFLEIYGVPKWRQNLMHKVMKETKLDLVDLEIHLRNIWKDIYPKFPISIVNSVDDAIELLNDILGGNIEEFNILISRLYSNLPDKYKADWRK
nr:SAP domain-containing protein [Lactococcus lactis]